MNQTFFMYQYWRGAGMRAQWLWPFLFALVQFAQACVSLACLGQWNPTWTLQFSRWRAIYMMNNRKVWEFS
jgi:hypothetical protein